MAGNWIDVGGRLHSIASGNVLAGANEILDESQNKRQSEINAETLSALAGRYTKDETYSRQEIDSMLSALPQGGGQAAAPSTETTETDLTSSYTAGYYHRSTCEHANSSDLYSVVIPVKAGDVIRSNTMVKQSSAVGCFLTDSGITENLKDIPTADAQEYTVTDGDVALGVTKAIWVYRVSTQTDPIYTNITRSSSSTESSTTELDLTSSYTAGYYHRSTCEHVNSSDLHSVVIPVKAGDVIRSNTMVKQSSAVGCFLTDSGITENLKDIPTADAQEYTVTDGDVALGVTKAIWVYRVSTQTDPIYTNITRSSSSTESSTAELDLTSSYTAGYYHRSTCEHANSSDLYSIVIPVKAGDVIRSNTMVKQSSAVGCFLTDSGITENLKDIPTADAQEYTVTDGDVALGVTKAIWVYRVSTQTVQIYTTLTRSSSSDGGGDQPVEVSYADNYLKDKTVILLGDSQLGQAQDVDTRVQTMTGAKAVYNWGFGGCRMAYRSADGTNAWDAFCMVNVADCLASGDFSSMAAQESIISQYAYFGTNVEEMSGVSITNDGANFIVCIAYGSNDFTGNNAIGEPDSFDKTTYKGALNYAVKTLLTAYPRLTIIIVGTPYRVYGYDEKTVEGITADSDTYTNSLGLHRYDYNDAAIEQAKVLKLPSFDMYRRSGRNKYNVWTLCPGDGTHPTSVAGRQAEAELYVKILRSF